MDGLLLAVALAFVVLAAFLALAGAAATWQQAIADSARNDAPTPAVSPPAPPASRPHNPRVPLTLAESLPPQTVRAMYRAAGLADPSCHCSLVDRPHLREDHP